MGRHSTFPDTVESCRTISISDLKKWGFLSGSRFNNIVWRRGEKQTAEVGIQSHLESDNQRISFHYQCRYPNGEKESLSYVVSLERFPSNLGVGYRYYFRCPFTGKRCIKLYMHPSGNVFAHRSHWKNLFYDCQLEGKYYKGINAYIKTHHAYNDLWRKPYLKTHYKGKLTSTMKRILKLERKSVFIAQMIRDHTTL